MKKVSEPITKTIDDVPQDVTKTMTETSKENNKALSILNDKFLELLKDRGIIASYLLFPVFKSTNFEDPSHCKIVKDLYSDKVNKL